MTPEQELQRAGEAKQVLGASVFIEACVEIEKQLAEARRKVPIRDVEGQSRLILMEQLWMNLTGFLEQLVQTGRMVELQLEQERQKKGWLADRIAMFRTSGRNSI